MRCEILFRQDDDLTTRDVLGLQPLTLQRQLDGLLCLVLRRQIVACESLAWRAACCRLYLASTIGLHLPAGCG
jgi:hypothetical protein